MYLKLIALEWKSLFRSANVGKSLAVKFFIGFIAVYFLVSFIGLGIGLYPISQKYFPNEEPIVIINKILLLWFLGEFILRFLLQNLPVVQTKPLLTQRISRGKIAHVLLWKSLLSFYNVLTLAVAIPFFIVNLYKNDYPLFSLLGWLIALFGFVLTLNFLNFWVQRRFSSDLKALVPFILICLGLIAVEYYNIYSVTQLFGKYFNLVLSYPVFGILPFCLLALCYILTYKDVKANLYLDSLVNKEQKVNEIADLSWTSKFGKLAPFIQLDLKLLWRNKRAKTAVYTSFGFLLYGLLFYTNPMYADSSMLIFVGIFMTGIFMISFGQFIPAWDSSYFPLLQTRPITIKTYLEAKAMLMYVSILILTILSSFYAYFGWDKLYMNVACAIYNGGINIPIILLFGAYNRKHIDLSNGNMFNYQGIGLAQWLVSLPLLIIPIVIWFTVKFLGGQNVANMVLIGLGVIGFLLRQIILNVLLQLYSANRFKMLEGFKQKG